MHCGAHKSRPGGGQKPAKVKGKPPAPERRQAQQRYLTANATGAHA